MIRLEASMVGNKYSQWGEESMIAQAIPALDLVKPGGGFVEFGGSMGKDNSNLFVFGEAGRSLIMIESDASLFLALETSTKTLPSTSAIHATVGYGDVTQGQSGRTLGQILSQNRVDPNNISVVSIDIDSDDAAVFENLGLDPLLVIVEYNNSFPSDVRIRNPRGKQWGNSSLELLEVAKNSTCS
jgi:hypothetical protein